jgi:hypothetical protein
MPEIHMSAAVAPIITLRGFFTSQKWLRGRSLSEIELLVGYRAGRLSTLGASVYGFTRVPDYWEFELAGYTNVSGGLEMDPAWVAQEQLAAAYHANTGMAGAATRLKNNARSSMTVLGPDRLIKVKPLLEDPFDSYPAGHGIPQWRVSKKAADLGTLRGELLVVLQPGDRYPV